MKIEYDRSVERFTRGDVIDAAIKRNLIYFHYGRGIDIPSYNHPIKSANPAIMGNTGIPIMPVGYTTVPVVAQKRSYRGETTLGLYPKTYLKFPWSK